MPLDGGIQWMESMTLGIILNGLGDIVWKKFMSFHKNQLHI
jgi:hypothetical protein